MKSKTKKIGAIIIIVITFMASLTYYEYATEPQGLQGTCYNGNGFNYTSVSEDRSSGQTVCLYSDNVSYLGNSADLMLLIIPGGHIYNLSQCVNTSYRGIYDMVYTSLFIHNESCAPLYGHLVISVTNFSIAFNKTMFYNVSTNKGDVFGSYIEFCPYYGFEGNCNFYRYGLGENPLPFRGPPKISMAKVIIPGNYTFYENITFTITVSLGILHFTSQEYSIHKTWWELWGYNDLKN